VVCVPFVLRTTIAALSQLDPALLDASQSLGAGGGMTFRRVTLPLSLPGVFAAFLLTFVPATGDYVNAAVLGGPGTTMIGNIIQDKFLTQNDYPQAAALSVILMLGMLVLASLYARILGTEDSTITAAAGGAA